MTNDVRKSAAATRRSRPVNTDTVLDEAARMFLVNGYDRTRMQDIADSFGVTHAALYYHFRNKQDILAHINIRALEKLESGARTILATDRSAAEKLLDLIRMHLLFVANNPEFVATFLEHDLEIPAEQFEVIREHRRSYSSMFAKLYDEARQAGAVVDIDPTVATSLILGACNWIYRWYQPEKRLNPEELTDQGMLLLSRLIDRSDFVAGARDGHRRSATTTEQRGPGAKKLGAKAQAPRKRSRTPQRGGSA